jgi:hypothetical protein
LHLKKLNYLLIEFCKVGLIPKTRLGWMGALAIDKQMGTMATFIAS